MRRVLTLIKREFMIKVKSKFFIIATLLGPFFMILISVAPYMFMRASEQTAKKLVFVDNTGIFEQVMKDSFTEKLKDGRNKYDIAFISGQEYEAQKTELEKETSGGDIKALIYIPEDIAQDHEMTYYSKSLGDMEFILSIKKIFEKKIEEVKLKEKGIDPEVLDEVRTTLDIRTMKLGKKGEKKEKTLGQDFIVAYIFVFILYITTVLYSNSILSGVLEEKTSRIIEVLLSSCSTFQLMIGKLFGVGSVGLFQYFVWGLLGSGAYFYAATHFPQITGRVNIPGELFGYFILFFILGFFQFATLFLVAGSLCSNQEDAKQIATPVTFLIIAPFIVSFMGMREPSHIIMQILSHIPFFTPMLMFVRIAVGGPSFLEIISSIVINIAAVFGLVYIAARIYRVGILMYGKRPEIKEVWKWIRY
ncbi:MAG: ABC transporter permease [Candidatus Muiribacteriaceae bacterium]